MSTAPRSQFSNFSSRAVYWMKELKDHPAGDPNTQPPIKPSVGSDWLSDQENHKRLDPASIKQLKSTHHITDCITFVTDVLQNAYRDLGDNVNAVAVKQTRFVQFGYLLAQYLVDSAGWKGFYWNPDPDLSLDRKYFVESPSWYIGSLLYNGPSLPASQEAAAYEQAYRQVFLAASPAEQKRIFDKIEIYVNEHAASARQARVQKVYHSIRIADSLLGYAPNQRGNPARDYLGHLFPPEARIPAKQSTQRALERLNAFNRQVTFGFGLARGGTHTFIFASGDVYEVHYSSGPADWPNQQPLFQVTPLINWNWESGAIIVPPDVHRTLTLPRP